MNGEELKKLLIDDQKTFEKYYLTKDNLIKLMLFEYSKEVDNARELEGTPIDKLNELIDVETIRYCQENIVELDSLNVISPDQIKRSKTESKQFFLNRLNDTFQRKNSISLRVKTVILSLTLMFTTVAAVAIGLHNYDIVYDKDEQKLGFTNRKEQYIENDGSEVLKYTLNWIPEGYELGIQHKEPKKFGTLYVYTYENNEGSVITLQVEEIVDNALSLESETNDIIDTFTISDVTYYETGDFENEQIIWNKHNCVFTLYGEVPNSLLKEIVINNESKR